MTKRKGQDVVREGNERESVLHVTKMSNANELVRRLITHTAAVRSS